MLLYGLVAKVLLKNITAFILYLGRFSAANYDTQRVHRMQSGTMTVSFKIPLWKHKPCTEWPTTTAPVQFFCSTSVNNSLIILILNDMVDVTHINTVGWELQR